MVKCSQEQCRESSARERLSDQVVSEVLTRAAYARREGRGKQRGFTDMTGEDFPLSTGKPGLEERREQANANAASQASGRANAQDLAPAEDASVEPTPAAGSPPPDASGSEGPDGGVAA